MLSKELLLIYIAIALGMVTACKSRGEDCIYVFPKNFEGNVIIIYDQNDGANISYEGKSRLIKLDSTGVLKTKFKPNYGIQKNSFFYADSIGRRYQIDYILPGQLEKTGEIVVYNQETGSDFDKKNNLKRHFEMLTVAMQKNVDSIANLRSMLMWKKLE
jgi:hypothetical protein